MAEQLQAMISQYSAQCSTLSMCPEDCKIDVTNAFTTCGPCLAGAEQLQKLPGLMEQKSQLEQSKSELKTKKEDLQKQIDDLKTEMDGLTPQMEQVDDSLLQVGQGIQQLQVVQQLCETPAPKLNTLHNTPVSLPQKGEGVSCMQVVQRFGILKEVMTAQATGAMDGLSQGALEMLQGLGAQGESIQGGSLQNNHQCVTSIDLTAGAECTDDSQCSSGHCAEGTTHNLNTRHCFRIDNHNSENCFAANDSGNQYPGHCNRCKDGFGWDDNWKCVRK